MIIIINRNWNLDCETFDNILMAANVYCVVYCHLIFT